tara:strand:- start:7685 stop:8821 length:1137 start_codon:yes stop_codon:yes gene_type:complete
MSSLIGGTVGLVIGVSAAVGAASTLVSTGVGMYSATKNKKNAARAAAGFQGEIDYLEDNRVEITNPYAGLEDLSGMMTDLSGLKTDLSDMASDLSGMITDTSGGLSNPMQNLGVATAAAEMQAEEADIALANTLDMLQATGSSAGGATALAQAALSSKKGIAANIQQQEKANADAAAAGEMKVQTQKMQAKNRVQDAAVRGGERLQGLKMAGARRVEDAEFDSATKMQEFGITEANRIQQAGVSGELFMYQEQDRRDQQELNRLASQLTGQQQVQAQASADYIGAIAGGVAGLGEVVGGVGKAVIAGSDRRLKNNIKLISKSPSGLNIYSFEYINKEFGKGTFQGVMSDEISQHAVIKNKDGYDMVDYSKLDVEFKNI